MADRTPGQPLRASATTSLRRLLPYARPALPALAASAVSAMAAMLCGLVFPLVIRQIIDGPIAGGDLSALWPLTGALLALGVFEAALFWVRRMLAARPTVRVEAAMRAAIYDHLQRLPVSFHDRWPAGQLMSRAVSDLTTIRRFLAFGLVFLVVNLTTFVVGVVILVNLSWQLGLIVAALAVPLIALCFHYESRYQVLARRSQDQVGDLATMVEESVLGIRILKAFGRSDYQGRRFLVSARHLRSTEIGKARVISQLWAVIVLVPEIAFGVTLFLGIGQVADGTLSAGTLVAFFGVALGLRWPIDSIGWLLAMSNDAASASQRFFEVMDAPITVSSPDKPHRLGAPPLRGRLQFTDVFSASVRENVLLGRPDGSDDDVAAALQVAQADFVHALPWGLDTRIGEQGLSLSGGQRQRLALARAVVARPAVLVLDDPLSALDIHTEARVETALRSVLAGTTALVIAHRASTVQLADRVALLDDGRITAVGTHSELMAGVQAYGDLLASRQDASAAGEGRLATAGSAVGGSAGTGHSRPAAARTGQPSTGVHGDTERAR